MRTLIFSQKFDEIETKIDELKGQLVEEEKAEFEEALANVMESYEQAAFSFRKANEAKKKAGFEELALSVSDFNSAYEIGKVEREEILKEVEKRFEEKIKELADADEETLAAVKEGLEKDVLKERQNQFLDQEKKNIDEKTAIYTFPTTWYQSVNPLAVVIFAPLFNLLWGFLRRRGLEPSTPVKFGIGLTLLSIAFMFMITGALNSVKTNGNAGAYWLLCTYLFCTWGELCLSPVGLSMVSRLAPARFASLLMGVWFLSSAIAGYLSGKLVAVLGSGSDAVSFCFGKQGGLADFFLILTLAPLIAGIIVFILSPKLRKMMHEGE